MIPTENPPPPALPAWRCHKTVLAVKIRAINLHDPEGSQPPVPFAGGFIIPDEPGVPPIAFDAAYWEKHQPKVGGYFVAYAGGYVSYSPAEAFESGYTRIEGGGLTFGAALEALKAGRRISRRGWNGKGMWLFLLPAGRIPLAICHDPALRAVVEANGGEIEALASIRMKTADNRILTGWLASQTDLLASDWQVHD